MGGGGGEYSREVINRGTAIIQGNMVYHNFCVFRLNSQVKCL